MAHGSPRINICHKCSQYIWVNRFSEDPKCPTCDNPSEQTDKQSIREKYWIGFLDKDWSFSFDTWTKLEKREQ